MRDETNLFDPDNNELKELGKMLSDTINKLMEANEETNAPNVYRELLTFENRENGRNEWVQINVSANFNPLYFCKDKATFTSYIPAQLGKELTEEKIATMKKVTALLMDNNVDGKLVESVLDLMEANVYSELNLLSATIDK